MTLEMDINDCAEDDGILKVVSGHQVVNSVTTPKEVTVAVDKVAVYTTVVSTSSAVKVEVKTVIWSPSEEKKELDLGVVPFQYTACTWAKDNVVSSKYVMLLIIMCFGVDGFFLMIINYHWKRTNQTNLAAHHVCLYIICEYSSVTLNNDM